MFENLKFKIKNSRQGVSLPIATGMVTLLIVASLAANELIIRTLQSVRSVEASSRAYYAAEAGTEDALYELSPHLPGYQTPSINANDDRKDVFDTKGNLDKCSDIGTNSRWANCWDIESRSGVNAWSGTMTKDQKLIISLYKDNSSATTVNNAINATQIQPNDIVNLRPSNFSITFSVMADEDSGSYIHIDNDQDGQVNEDGPGTGPNKSSATCANPDDADCDGKVDEDYSGMPLILWKLTDNTGHSLIPKSGCMDHNIKNNGSQLCESNFIADNTRNFVATLDSGYTGINELGDEETISNFISSSSDDSRMQFEFLIVAPMEYVNQNNQKKQPFDSIQYDVNSDSADIPYPYFDIKSDGYYGTYKQSIDTRIFPSTSVPLFDFTIIQQQ
jgi:hypothetical protein